MCLLLLLLFFDICQLVTKLHEINKNGQELTGIDKNGQELTGIDRNREAATTENMVELCETIW